MYSALAYYCFVALEEPHLEVKKHKKFFKDKEITCRIYLSEEGINGQLSGPILEVEEYINWLQSDSRFAQACFKMHATDSNVFPRVSVKYRPQLVALDCDIPLSRGDLPRGEHISPERWSEMLEQGGYLLLDVRNQYEWEVGHFENALLPPLEKFRDFPLYAEKLAQEVDKSTPVMMYCTGGIRCELYSALLKQKGFEQVYQLDGGVINYGLKVGTKHWKGKLFVFDDRLVVPIDGKPCDPLSHCCHCQLPCDTYYNCANMDCNELFIACSSCCEFYKGACGYSCKESDRLRPLDPGQGNRPFRRKHLIGTPLIEPKSAPACSLSRPSDQA